MSRRFSDTRKRFIDTKIQVKAQFEYAEKLASLVQRQREIEDAFDLTKNQVGGQVAA